MSKLKVGIQGIEASFHDLAAHRFFPGQGIELIECPSFKVLSERLAHGDADRAMIAIENTIAGSILTNYSLLERYRFKIIGEVYLRIQLSVMALPGQSIGDIRFVQSHPMALHQCEDFLFGNPHLKVIEAADTAESAKSIGEQGLHGYAAVASEMAAARYGLEILESGIESNKLNYTRFLAICREGDYLPASDSDKSSLRFEAENSPGSLAEILGTFSAHEINMTKIQSVPILGKPYQYSIHVDLEWEGRQRHQDALRELAGRSMELFHFGEYKRGEKLQ